MLGSYGRRLGLELAIVQKTRRWIAAACVASLALGLFAKAGSAEPAPARVARAAPAGPIFAAHDLGIAPDMQQTFVWCWLAVGEMIFRHYGVPETPNGETYQCGIVQSISIATNMSRCAGDCSLCVVPAAGARDFVGMLADYPRRAAVLTGEPAPRVFATVAGVLRPSEVRDEIDAGNPVVAGINPDRRPAVTFQAPAHVALIVGYTETKGALLLRVNDPFPYPAPANPYPLAGGKMLQPGSYEIAYDAFERLLAWRESYLVRAAGRHAPRGSGSTPRAQTAICTTPAGACRLPASQPEGSPCSCPDARGSTVPGTAS